MVKQSSAVGVLLHNRKLHGTHRYRRKRVPVHPRAILHSDVDLLHPVGMLVDGHLNRVATLQNAKEHAEMWLKGKRGISCNTAGGYCGEYNFRHFMHPAADTAEQFIQSLGAVYRNIFENN